jgi:hypothetical protein
MRIWTLHPKYLDRQGLLATWRESLLAQAVLRKKTKGYRNHPQLIRFREQQKPLEAINTYLWHIYIESSHRGYNFDRSKIRTPKKIPLIPVQEGQVEFERNHLLLKLKKRDPDRYESYTRQRMDLHPLFQGIPGGKETWEKGT